MALIFEYEKTLETGLQPCMSHEPDSVLYNYYISGDFAVDKNASINNGQYDNISFADEQRHLTTRGVSKIGVKNFPGIGGIGFYKDVYSDECLIVAPIHVKRDNKNAPTLTLIEIVDNKLHVVITPPKDLNYTCYRVIVRQGAFAFEYITYKTDYYMDMPTVKGDYMAYCMGYDEDNGTSSGDSNVLPLNVPTGTDDWSPYFETVHSLETKVEAIENSIDGIDDLEARTEILETHVIGEGGSGIPFSVNAYSTYSGDDSSSTTQASTTIDATGTDNTIFAIVTVRSTPTFPDGWEVMQQFDPTYYGTDTTRQTLYILKKEPTSSTETFSMSVAEAGHIYITLLNLSGVKDLTVHENNYNTDASGLASGSTVALTKLSNKALYIHQAISVATGQTVTVSPSDNCLIIPNGSRLFVVVDTSTDITHTLSFSGVNTGLQILSLNIVEDIGSSGLLARVSDLESDVGDIGTILDEINGVEV